MKGPALSCVYYHGYIDSEVTKKYSQTCHSTVFFLLAPRSFCPTVQVTCLGFGRELPGKLVSPSSNQCTSLPPCPYELHGSEPFDCFLMHDQRWNLMVWVNIFFLLPTGLVSASVFGWLRFPWRFHVKRHEAKCPYCKLCLRYSRVLLPK